MSFYEANRSLTFCSIGKQVIFVSWALHTVYITSNSQFISVLGDGSRTNAINDKVQPATVSFFKGKTVCWVGVGGSSKRERVP